jgi:hypothetical protein
MVGIIILYKLTELGLEILIEFYMMTKSVLDRMLKAGTSHYPAQLAQSPRFLLSSMFFTQRCKKKGSAAYLSKIMIQV